MTFAKLRDLFLAFSCVEESTSYRTPALFR